MNGTLIACAGAHARDIRAIMDDLGMIFAGYLDDEIDGPEVVGDLLDVEGAASIVIGHNNSRTRERIDLNVTGHSPILIHPSAVVHRTAQLAPGVVIGPNTTIGPQVRLGRHTHINGNVFVTRAHLGDFCTVSPGATICGDVTIGAGCQIGAGATISNLVTINPRVTIGAGAVVLPNFILRSNTTWVGVPAREVVR